MRRKRCFLIFDEVRYFSWFNFGISATRTISRPVGGISPSMGVPFTATSAFTGTDSGCSGSVASVCSSPTRSVSSSPAHAPRAAAGARPCLSQRAPPFAAITAAPFTRILARKLVRTPWKQDNRLGRTQPDDPARAHADACLAHVLQGLQPVLIPAQDMTAYNSRTDQNSSAYLAHAIE